MTGQLEEEVRKASVGDIEIVYCQSFHSEVDNFMEAEKHEKCDGRVRGKSSILVETKLS